MTTSTNRGSAFWVFVFGVAFGAVLGAVLMHKYLSEYRPPAAPPPAAEAPREPHAEDSIARTLRQWHLTPDDIRRQLDHAGQVIKREGGALGEKLDEATRDARVVTVIKAKYTLDPQLSAWEIGVASDDGHVTLSGTVNTSDLAVRAVVLALDTHGVVDVASSLRVKPSSVPTAPAVER